MLLVIAGHNGAGKTTCYETRLKPQLEPLLSAHINPDEVEKEMRAALGPNALTDKEFSLLAQTEAEQMREDLLDGGESFSFETVGSHISKVEFIQRARRQGYVVGLLFVGLESAEKSQERVAARVSRGGHDVPPAKIVSRYISVIENMAMAVRAASVALVVDNSRDGDPQQARYLDIALFVSGELVSTSGDLPEWVEDFIAHEPNVPAQGRTA